MTIDNCAVIDSHCHPHFPQLVMEEVLQTMDSNNVRAALAVATCRQERAQVLELINQYPGRFYAACGIHPCVDEDIDIECLQKWCEDDKIIAVGETGLDYFHQDIEKKRQIERFIMHIEVAKSLKKPLIIHMRDSFDDVMDLLYAHKANECLGVMHCFTGEVAQVKRILDLGFYISFSGIISFKKAIALQEVAAYVPNDKYLIETDSPYLAPVPFRGKTNTPGYVRHVANAVAIARGCTVNTVADETSKNFYRLFGNAIKII